MTEQIKQIAERIRTLREISDLTAEQVASALNVTLQQYENIENGVVDIPLSFMYAFATFFKVDLSAIFTGDNARLHQYAVVRKGKGDAIDRRAQYNYESLASNFANAKMEPFVVTVEAKEDSGIAQSSHIGQELNYVLEGKLKIIIGTHEVVLEAGDCVYFDAGLPHGMQALDGNAAKFLAVIL
ncbi:MAG: helix-turn-helix transcriptional regulator [Hyphomonadaceae bacterium]|nr:helix-turn-helix transcriptional regulator [Clostridia bacterium]